MMKASLKSILILDCKCCSSSTEKAKSSKHRGGGGRRTEGRRVCSRQCLKRILVASYHWDFADYVPSVFEQVVLVSLTSLISSGHAAELSSQLYRYVNKVVRKHNFHNTIFKLILQSNASRLHQIGHKSLAGMKLW